MAPQAQPQVPSTQPQATPQHQQQLFLKQQLLQQQQQQQQQQAAYFQQQQQQMMQAQQVGACTGFITSLCLQCCSFVFMASFLFFWGEWVQLLGIFQCIPSPLARFGLGPPHLKPLNQRLFPSSQ